MKEFNLEKALAGEKVVMRDGTPVLAIFMDDPQRDDWPLMSIRRKDNGMVDYDYHNKNGRAADHDDHTRDLFMAPKVKKVWIAVSRYNQSTYIGAAAPYDKREDLTDRLLEEHNHILQVEIEE